MKRIFTICIPDDCYLKLANIVVIVEKNDHSDNGMTVFTGYDVNSGKWLFTTDGKAIQVVEPQESEG